MPAGRNAPSRDHGMRGAERLAEHEVGVVHAARVQPSSPSSSRATSV